MLQDPREGTTVGDVGLKEGDKIDLVQTIRVKVVGPLADGYQSEMSEINECTMRVINELFG